MPVGLGARLRVSAKVASTAVSATGGGRSWRRAENRPPPGYDEAAPIPPLEGERPYTKSVTVWVERMRPQAAGDQRIQWEQVNGLTPSTGASDGAFEVRGEAAPGRYRLVFAMGEYFAAQGVALPDPPFVDEVVLDFGVADAATHYHVPLLVSPWSYSTYRGS